LLLLLKAVYLAEKQRYQLNNLRVDPTGNRTHDLQLSRRARSTFHNRCGCDGIYTHECFL